MPPPVYTGRRAGLSNSYEPLNRRTPQQRDCSRLSPERRAFPFGGCPRLSRRARRAFRMDICPSALTRRCVFASLYARELWAGAMLCLAGFSSGRGDCARGGCSAGRCGSCAGLRSSYAGRAAFTYGVCARYRGGAFVRHYMMVNRGPAKGCVWPVIAPAEGIVRAGGCVRSMPVVRYWDVLCSFAPIIRSCRSVLCSITPAVCRMSAKQDGLRYVPFLFRRGS